MTTAYSEAGRSIASPSELALHGLTIIVFFAASSMTTLLFPLYQTQWSLTAFVISVVFAIYAGALPTGVVFGAGFLRVLRSLVVHASASERAGLISALYIGSHVPNAILAILAGYTAQQAGLYAAGKAFCAFIVVIAIMPLLVRVPDIEPAKAA